MKRKKLFSIMLASIGLLLITGCSNASEESANGELNIIGWSEYVPENVIQDFEKESGITVNYTTYSDPNEMLAKVKSSSEGTYDMALAPGMYVETFRNLDMLEKLDMDSIKNFGNISEISLSQVYDSENEYSVPYLGTAMAIAANTDEIPEEFTSYKDLLNPKYQNSMVTVEDARAVVGIALMQAGYDINDTSDEALAAATDYLTALKPNIKIFDGTSPKTSLINGEVSIGLIYAGEIALAMDANPAIKIYYPEENSYFGFDTFMEFKNSENSENVEKFIDYILEPEVSADISQQFPYYNPNTAALDLLPEDYKQNEAKVVPDAVIQRSEAVLDLGEDTEKIDQVWSTFKN